MKKKVSIVIPVYNHQKALERALVSIAAQTYRPIEVIVVDDGSTEPVDVPDIDLLGKVRIVRQPNAGAAAARNSGFKKSSGEYIIFWDADVEADPQFLEHMVKELEEHPDISFVYTGFTIKTFGDYYKQMFAQSFDISVLESHNFIHSTSLVRREAVVKWDESLNRFQDWDFFLQIVKKGGVGKPIKKILFAITDHGTMSEWLPRVAYKIPWKWLPGIRKKVQAYEAARGIVLNKFK